MSQVGKLLAFAGLQASLSLVELFYAGRINSSALRAHGYHTSLEALQTATHYLSASLLKRPADAAFSYGYGRVATLFEYCGSAIITMLCASLGFFALLEVVSLEGSVIHRAGFTSPLSTSEVAPAFAAFALVDSTLAILLTRVSQVGGSTALPRASDPHASHSLIGCWGLGRRVTTRLELLQSAVLVATGLLLQLSGFFLVDALGCLIAVALVAPQLLAVFARTAPILLQKAPVGPRAAFDKSCREVSTFEGVVECYDEHLWMNAPGQLVGSLKVKVDGTRLDPRDALARIRARFTGAVNELTVSIEAVENPGGGGRLHARNR